MRAFKTQIFSICLCLLLALAAPQIQAQSNDDPFSDANKMAEWSLESEAIFMDVLGLFDDPDLQYLLENVINDEASEEELMERFRIWQRNLTASIETLDDTIANRTLPPKLKEKSNEAGLYAKDKVVVDVYAETKVALSQTETYLKRAIAGDMSGLPIIRAIQIKSIINVLESETAGLKLNLAGADDTHPQTYIGNISIEVNDFMISTFQIKIDYLNGHILPSDRGEHVKAMKTTLKQQKELIKKGRKAAKVYIAKMEAYNKTLAAPSEKEQVNGVIKLMEMYAVGFDAEQAIWESQNATLKLFESDARFEDIEPEIDDESDNFADAMQVRLSEQTRRMTFISTL